MGLLSQPPLIFLLTILGAISYATEDLFAAGVIALMVAISTLLNFIQEARSTKAADALKAMVSNTATVLRVINDKGENGWLEIPIDQLVPGDIIKTGGGGYESRQIYVSCRRGICSSLRRR
ncbi:Mg(2+) transport ATPase, P-type [Escherichia coli]|uniref:Mg(2+) transport ATPase, P-type n=1 Tax=Escherichia coli TaxID=562 RepID=A0A376MPR1_ECOLX|nr:Mg(2+) transport ATPase, P-type [Escherichia coli]